LLVGVDKPVCDASQPPQCRSKIAQCPTFGGLTPERSGDVGTGDRRVMQRKKGNQFLGIGTEFHPGVGRVDSEPT
jgi:hypothetical protein